MIDLTSEPGVDHWLAWAKVRIKKAFARRRQLLPTAYIFARRDLVGRRLADVDVVAIPGWIGDKEKYFQIVRHMAGELDAIGVAMWWEMFILLSDNPDHVEHLRNEGISQEPGRFEVAALVLQHRLLGNQLHVAKIVAPGRLGEFEQWGSDRAEWSGRVFELLPEGTN